MVIKSKKSKYYSIQMKAFAVVLYLSSILVAFLAGTVFLNLYGQWQGDLIQANSYYETNAFRSTVDMLLDDVVAVDIVYKNEEKILNGDSINREDLISSFKSYYGVVDGIITKSTEINDTYDGLIIRQSIPNNLYDNFIEYRGLVEDSLPKYRAIYIQSQLEDYRSRKRELSKYSNFYYYLEDENDKKIAGNTALGQISKLSRTMVSSGDFFTNNMGFYMDYQNNYLKESGYKLYAGVADPFIPSDPFFTESQNFDFAKGCLIGIVISFMIACVLLVISYCYLIQVTGQKVKGGEVKMHSIDKIYNDVNIVLMFIFVIFCSLASVVLADSIFYRIIDFWAYIFSMTFGALVMFAAGIFLNFSLCMSRQIKSRQFFSNTLSATMIRRVGALCSGKTFKGWVVFMLLGFGAVNCILAAWAIHSWIYDDIDIFLAIFSVLCVFNFIAAYLCIRALTSLSEIMISAKETSKGNLSYALDITKISPSFINFATDVSNIQNGLKNAVEEAVKGERMKAELITNVSHDLKTPLTSIITYADLLKHEKLENERATGYVNVLHEKSYRLKQLIEDLIEASKASSGNITVARARVDLRQLVMQAVGELEEKIENAGLDFIISCEEETAVFADGRHMWRIVENLLTNTIKYSMPRSRVYINILKTSDTGMLVVKNISENAIQVSAEQLTDRFVRGDESRTTEGSGLGLSISKSLSELQGGQLIISIDGDLFKAAVKMPLYKEPDLDLIVKKEESSK